MMDTGMLMGVYISNYDILMQNSAEGLRRPQRLWLINA